MNLTISSRNSILDQECRNKFHDKISKAKDQFIDELENEIKKDIPKIPQDLIDSGYIKMSCSVRVYNLTSHREYFNLKNSYPCTNYENFDIQEPSAKIKKAYSSWQKTETDKGEFRKKLSRALYCFNTTKQLGENIPELAKYVAENKNKDLIPLDLIKEIRRELK